MSTVVVSNLHFEPTANNRLQSQNNVLGVYDSGTRKFGANSTHLVFKNNTAEGNLYVSGNPFEPGMYVIAHKNQGTPNGFVLAGNAYSKNLYANLYSKFGNVGSLVFQLATGTGDSGSISKSTSFGFGNGIFVSWSPSTGFVKSTNGLTWSNSGITQPGNGGITVTSKTIAYGNGVFIAGGDSGRLTRSTDNGNTWSNAYIHASGSPINRIFYGNGTFVLVNNSGATSISTNNGLGWSNAVSIGGGQEPGYFQNGEYVNGNFITIRPSAVVNGAIIYSNDGITWSNATGFSTNTANVFYYGGSPTYIGMAYGHLGFIAVSNYANLAVSNDGITWTYLNYPNTSTWGNPSDRYGSGSEAFYFGGKYIIGRSGTTSKLVSTDLVNWFSINLNFSTGTYTYLTTAPESPVFFVYNTSANLFVTTPSDKFYVPEHPLISNTNPYYMAYVKV